VAVVGIKTKRLANNWIIGWFCGSAAVLFLQAQQREGSVALSAAAGANTAQGSSMASCALSFRLLINLVFVFVAKVVPPATAAPRLAAVVTHITMVAARFTIAPIASVAPIGVLFEHAGGEFDAYFVASHVVARSAGL